jgi:energy-coupling factor transporter transmembrane protein EcfT
MTGEPRLRLAIALAAIALAGASPRPAGALAVAAVAVLALAGARARRRHALRVLGTSAVLAAIAALMGGVTTAMPVLARALAGGAVAAWLVATLPLAGLLAALAWARCPTPLLELLALAERQIGQLARAVDGVREAQRARLGYEGFVRRVRSTGVLAGAVTARAFDLAAATAECLAVRGDPTLGALPPPRWSASRDGPLAASAVAALAACAAIAWGTP